MTVSYKGATCAMVKRTFVHAILELLTALALGRDFLQLLVLLPGADPSGAAALRAVVKVNVQDHRGADASGNVLELQRLICKVAAEASGTCQHTTATLGLVWLKVIW